jgi:hypothetical protein
MRKTKNDDLQKNENINTKVFSIDTLIKSLLLLLSRSVLGEFVIQQNEIQFLLTNLILLRANHHGLIDKEWRAKIEKFSLGNLIFVYKACAYQTIKEGNLVKNLEKYNSTRNKIIHRLSELFHEEIKNVIITKSKEIRKPEILVSVFELGKKIKADLIDILKEEIKAKNY